MKIFSKIKWALIVGSICLWVLAVDHIAKETQKEITVSLSSFAQSAEGGLIRPILNTYDRSFLSSRFSVSLASDHPSVDSLLKDIVVTAKVQHGPLIISNQRLRLKTAHVALSFLDRENPASSTHMATAEMSIDYDLMRQIEVKLNSLNLDIAGIEIASKDAIMQYYFHPDDEFPEEIAFPLPRFRLNDSDVQADISNGEVLLSLSSTLRNLDSLRFTAGEASLDIRDVISVENAKIAAEIAFTDKDIVSVQTDLVSNDNSAEESTTNIKMDNLNLDSFKDTFLGFLNYRSLHEQIDWTLEDSAYSPDGQDRVYELLSRLDENTYEMTHVIANRLLTPNKSTVQITQTGQRNLVADLTFLGLSKVKRQSPWFNSFAGTLKTDKTIPAQSMLRLLNDYTSLVTTDTRQTQSIVKIQGITAEASN